MKRAFVLLALLVNAQTFHILEKANSKTHQDITRSAILNAATKACEKVETFKKLVKTQGKMDETQIKACGNGTLKNFEAAIKIISRNNLMTDVKHPFSAKYHFDNEEFAEGKRLITTGIQNITQLVARGRFDNARQKLGEILHTLQDFYSHSNWIELGNTAPYTDLINPDKELNNLADRDRATCETNCANENCGAKFLPGITVLTSGYFGIKKPTGKCSHGGTLDFTTGIRRSWDGINKDHSDSSHGTKHNQAAEIAIEASVQLLENIQEKLKKTGENNFLRLMGLHPEVPSDEWTTNSIPFTDFKDRYPEATADISVQV
ncbi:hypothetical protein Q8A67_001448 [Cirrhinus molitorella]|uniref:VWA7 N-terminal domain-containing protein n=1 Tax=Cirrhinus molitorella TaxID=172907 RepID=A0AA88QRF6_9TELE|nr:hypothetical protein Q8A67_001448 [Cirrhinus molitorella]